MNYELFCYLPFIVILFLALPLLFDPGAVDRIISSTSRRPPTHAPGHKNIKKQK